MRTPCSTRSARLRPELIYHLAALSHVGRSWEEPAETVMDNVAAAVNVLEAIRHGSPGARVVWVSSCEVYGAPERLPVEERARARARRIRTPSPSRRAICSPAVYADAHGLDIVRARPFNHAGPGQLPIFIVSSLARQAAEARLSGARRCASSPATPTRAATSPTSATSSAPTGCSPQIADPGVYNVSTGRSISAAEQVGLDRRADGADRGRARGRSRPRARKRSHGPPRRQRSRRRPPPAGDPKIPFRQTMSDTIDWWERRAVEPGPPGAMRH